MKRLGPELKMPDLSDLKVPAVITDVYLDLRDRRLLPLIALVVVAIAAVPFLLGDEPEPQLPPPVTGQQGSATGVDAASFTVVEATPGLRAPSKRLEELEPTNPFKQRYTSLPKAAKLESTSSTSSTSAAQQGEGGIEEVVSEVEGSAAGSPSSPSSGGSTSEGSGATQQRLEFVIDVQIRRTAITEDGAEEAGELEIRRNVPILAQLPGEKTPVTTLMGANFQKKRLVFLVSHEVKAVTGEYSCITRGEICELLEVAPGMLLNYVYEPSGARYEIKVTDARVIPARKGADADSPRGAFIESIPAAGQFQK